NLRARHTTEVEVRRQAIATASQLEQYVNTDAAINNATVLRKRLQILNVFRKALNLDGMAVITVEPNGTIRGDDLPSGLKPETIQIGSLRGGNVVSGTRANLAFAAAPARLANGNLIVVVLAREANSGLKASFRTFVLAAIATLAIGGGVAIIL